MRIADVRKILLGNLPNISRYACTPQAHKKITHDTVEWEGRMYRVGMHYVIHGECGTRIRALVTRKDYNTPGFRYYNNIEKKPLLVFCPECRAQVGKWGKRQLAKNGRLYSFHGMTGLGDSGSQDYVGAYYIFPMGVGFSQEGVMTSLNTDRARLMDADEVEAELDMPEYDGN